MSQSAVERRVGAARCNFRTIAYGAAPDTPLDADCDIVLGDRRVKWQPIIAPATFAFVGEACLPTAVRT